MPLPTSTLPRRDRERLARRGEILRAALKVFAEKGFGGATLEEVAERAEFGKGTLYNYFPGGKEEILFALIDEVYEEMAALILEYFREHDATAATRAVFHGFIERFLGYFLERQTVFLLLIKEAQRLMFDDQQSRAAHLLRHRKRLADVLAAPIESAINCGALRPHDPRAVAHALLGNIHGVLMAATCAPEGEAPIKPDPSAGADFIVSILFDGLLSDANRS